MVIKIEENSFLFYFQMQNSRNSVSQKFLESENRRAKDLEFLIDSHIEQLKLGTEKMIKKNKR